MNIRTGQVYHDSPLYGLGEPRTVTVIGPYTIEDHLECGLGEPWTPGGWWVKTVRDRDGNEDVGVWEEHWFDHLGTRLVSEE